MLKLYCAVDGELRECNQSKLEDALWVDAIAPSYEEVDLLNKTFKLQLQDVADCLDPNERSRIELDDNYDLLVLRSLIRSAKENGTVQTMPIGIFVTPRNIITVRLIATFSGSDLMADFRKKPRIQNTGDLFLALIRKINRDIDRKVRPMEGQISVLQKAVLSRQMGEIGERAYNLNSELILLNTSLLSNFNAISMIGRARHISFTEDQADILEDLENDVSQLYDMTTIYREIMQNILRAHESAIANNLSSIMKMLTSISLILMLPTLIASLYGMNVDLPLQNDPLAFWIIIAISAVTVAFLWLAFKVKKLL